MFKAARRKGLIPTNPVDDAELPDARRDTRDRVILTNDEWSQFVSCEAVDLELRMMSMCTRILGGMRTGAVNALDWTNIVEANFAECRVPRPATRRKRPPPRLTIPDTLRPLLRTWWETNGCPFRRAFNTALAEAGVNVQHAMHLAGHSDAKTHMGYVMTTTKMRTIPAEAVTPLPPVLQQTVAKRTAVGRLRRRPRTTERFRRLARLFSADRSAIL